MPAWVSSRRTMSPDDVAGRTELAGKLGQAGVVLAARREVAVKVVEPQAAGAVVEAALLAVDDGEATADDQAAGALMLDEVFPMRSECREPHHSGRPGLISASVQSARCRSGETERMGNTSGRLTQKAGRGANSQLRTYGRVSGTHTDPRTGRAAPGGGPTQGRSRLRCHVPIG